MARRDAPTCCCPENDCPEHVVNFDDGTFGTLVSSGDVGFVIEDLELHFTPSYGAEYAWTVPFEDTDSETIYSVSALVIGEGEIGPEQNDGGVFITGTGSPAWKVFFGIEDGELVLRTENLTPLDREKRIANQHNGGAGKRLTLTARTVCATETEFIGRTSLGETLYLKIGGIMLEEAIGGTDPVEYTLPTSVDMGVYAPDDPGPEPEPGENRFEACCDPDLVCFERTVEVSGEIDDADPEHDHQCGTDGPFALGWSTSDIAAIAPATGMLSDNYPAFVPENGYFIGAMPFTTDGVNGFAGWRVLIWCDGGTLAGVVINQLNSAVGALSNVSLTCSGTTFEWVAEWGDVSQPCGIFGQTNFRMTFTFTTTECEGQDFPRRFDDVRLYACTGTPPGECPTFQTGCCQCDEDGPDENGKCQAEAVQCITVFEWNGIAWESFVCRWYESVFFSPCPCGWAGTSVQRPTVGGSAIVCPNGVIHRSSFFFPGYRRLRDPSDPAGGCANPYGEYTWVQGENTPPEPADGTFAMVEQGCG